MTFSVKESIRDRKSVRTFDGRKLSEQDREALLKYIKTVRNPFETPVEFRLLSADEHGLTSPVVIGAEDYIAAKTTRCRNFEIGYGYSFESVCLYAKSLGIGTVILAASINRSSFEKAMDVKEGEVMPVATPVGYPASRRSIREVLMRKGIKADSRFDFDKIFFENDFSKGLSKEKAGAFADALEMLRWAPSAVNKQPWRAVVSKDTVHFYEAKSMKDSPLGDLQKIDMGIGLAHFDLALKEEGISGHFVEKDPGIEHNSDVQYIISYEKETL